MLIIVLIETWASRKFDACVGVIEISAKEFIMLPGFRA
jgi:hypothetical protein